MIIVENIPQLIAARDNLKGSVALVTTMGNLHLGHLSLIERAKNEADFVVATIYVNPLQFSVNEDLSSYPRTLEEDIRKLEALGVDLLFTPSDEVIYPAGMHTHTQVIVPGISDQYCGENRKGHFRGVTTVVCKLFNLIRPQVAIFGYKDFQQFTIIQKMVSNLAMPIKIVGIETYREASGLAMSSRNRYLTDQEKDRASGLYEALIWAKKQLLSNNLDFNSIEDQAKTTLKEQGFVVEYFAVCDRNSLQQAKADDKKLVILTGSSFGKPRLIDNITLDL
ncbi:MAG: pantoate--beta-alanine ligase [Enterobacterales bacterium]|jgi:pantoate--beta-alanine ligase